MNYEKFAEENSKRFLEEESQYQLGFVEAEQSNAITKTLGEAYRNNTSDGVKMLLEADRAAANALNAVIASREFDLFFEKVKSTILNGGKIIISGCGSTGRLAIRIEASWREAAKKYERLSKYSNSVLSLMTGGDFAIIRAVESFEDYTTLGEMQARDISISSEDLLIGVTATGETTSILGTAHYALSIGAAVYMIVCTEPKTIIDRLERAKRVYMHKKCKSLYVHCGGMALTGSTRMQSSSIEQTLISVALEMTADCILYGETDKNKYADIYLKCVEALNNNTEALTAQTEIEARLYSTNGYVTYFANEYLLDVLADTTERGPTFSVPPFRPQVRKDLPLSWAFVKNPYYNTAEAWKHCFKREMRCVDKTNEQYREIGISEADIKKIPRINNEALLEFEIGNEADKEREQGNSCATWIDLYNDNPDEFIKASGNYSTVTCFVPLANGKDALIKTKMNISEHLAMKLAINIMSTGTMARLGRIFGNYMIYINITNKKLIDRATRIISELCNISYEQANYELFLSKAMLEESGEDTSPVKLTLDRLK